MAVDKPKLDPGILELLYPDELGELDEAEVRALRDEAELSAHNARDLKAFDAMLERIRAEDPGVEVRASVHDSIMAAARAHRENAASASAPTPTPVPEADRPPSQIAPTPIWARIPMNTARQFALAASVLLVAGVFFVMMRPSPEQKFTSANSKITADVSFDGPARAHAPAAQGAKPEALAAAPEVDERELDEQQVAKGAEPTQAPTELALNTGLGSDSPLSSRPEGMGSPSSSGRAASSMPEERAASSRSNSTEQKPSAPTKRETRARAKPLAESAGAIDRGRKDRAPAAQSAPALADKADFALDSVASAEKSEKAPQAPTDTYRMDAIAESFAS